MTWLFFQPTGWFAPVNPWWPILGPPAPFTSPINRPAPRNSGQVQFPKSCCRPEKCFVATYTYTAINGENSATITRQCFSELSEAHARTLARLAAIKEASAEVGLT